MRLLLFPPILMLLAFVPAGIAHRYLDRATRPPFLIHGVRWFLGLLFVFSGLAKLIPHFPNTMGPPDLEATLAPHGLALYGRFIAVAEVGTGLLLLTRRFATLGALLLVPILSSIIVVTWALNWRGTPYVVCGFLLLAAVLLAYDYPKLAVLLQDRSSVPAPSRPRLRSALIWLAGLGLASIGLGVTQLAPAGGPGTWIVLTLLGALIVSDWRSAAS
jgi:hypothetical protein